MNARLAAAPKLATKARLRHDRVADRKVLLSPERGLELNATAAMIVEAIDGVRSAEAIVSLVVERTGEDRAVVEADVIELLDELASRRLIDAWVRA